MSQTYDDSLLDDGSSGLEQMLDITLSQKKASQEAMIQLLVYLLSPTASRRSALTTIDVIHKYGTSKYCKSYGVENM
jgi:hypothetical protein